MSKYTVVINNERVKEYPTKLQAVIYLVLKGYCSYHYRYGYWIDNRARIEVQDE